MSDEQTPEINVWESRQQVMLHFAGEAAQSLMRKSDPYALEFEYTRKMMAWLPLCPEPADVLLVGLGGGSLSKFCYKHLPESRIVTVEISPAVIGLRKTFHIPPDDERFRIELADAVVYLHNKTAIADIILLDGYTADGLPEALSNDNFYRACAQALRPHGIVIANLWRRDPRFRQQLALLNRIFQRQVVRLSCESGNEVVFAFADAQLPPFAQVWKRAQQLQKQTGLTLPLYLEDMVFNSLNGWFYSDQG